MFEKVEYRMIEVGSMKVSEETRDDGSKERAISGYAAVFEKLSVNLGGYKEKIARGAFADSISGGDIIGLWSHNTDIVLARTSNGTLKLEEDDTGLKFRMALDDDAWGEYAYKKIKRGDVKGMSFGFRTIPKGEKWEMNENKEYIRTLLKVGLLELSPTPFPAYPDTSVGARQVRSAEDILRSAKEALFPEPEFDKRAASERARLLQLIAAC